MPKILFLANIQYGQPPTGGGAQAKNQIFLNYLQSRFKDVTFYDTWHKNHVISLLVCLFKILFAGDRKIILSLSNPGVVVLARIMSKLSIKREMYFWVIGGGRNWEQFGKGINSLSCFKYIIVQAEYIKKDLEQAGLSNIKVVRNFKNTKYFPVKKENRTNIVRFVFLSRLIEEKGVGLIIDAAKQIGCSGYEIDFYGLPSQDYSEEYFSSLGMSTVKYQGFLDLKSNAGYNILSEYDVMLFPTFFAGEGFPGILIDAFIAGLPVVASNFHANPEVIIDGKNGILIEPKSVTDLSLIMRKFINREYDLPAMQNVARYSAQHYLVQNVLSDNLLKEIGFL
jgi:glycosyltransferase involved in cell wall biosynthesis